MTGVYMYDARCLPTESNLNMSGIMAIKVKLSLIVLSSRLLS